ncbi:hypothetical protein [Planctomicrobium sp. SH527]|uniref:hypothetical protein n=1 Tax=Planctomicrobium sp. SH527 TaxID=3448123 RepID=UPI003F5C91E3
MMDSQPYRIRLQGPWQVVLPDGDVSDRREISVPCDWLTSVGSLSGMALFYRRFNRPTNIEERDRVLIRLPDQVGVVTRCELNQQPVECESDNPCLFDVTAQLKLNNEVMFAIEFTPTPENQGTGGLWRPAILEIHTA